MDPTAEQRCYLVPFALRLASAAGHWKRSQRQLSHI